MHFISISCALKYISPCIIYLVKNTTLSGNPNFAQYATNSCSWLDTSATTCTLSSNEQLLLSGHLGDTGNLLYDFMREDQ